MIFNSSLVEYHYVSDDSTHFIDRKKQIEQSLSIINRCESFLIVGERGVGKTSLLKQIQKELKNDKSKILPIYISFSDGMFIKTEPKAVIYQILSSLIIYIWKDILRLNLTDLYSSDNITKVKKSKLSKHTLKAYRLIHTQYRELIRKDHFEIETNMFLKGTTGRNTDINSHLEPLYYNELISLFCELCDELKKQIHCESIVFLCDEANLLNPQLQFDIAQGLGAVFSSIKYSFVYVVSMSIINNIANEFKSVFQHEILLEGFQDEEYSKQLILKRIIDKNRIVISEDVFPLIHKLSRGVPRYIIELMYHAIIKYEKDCFKDEIIKITTNDIYDAYDIQKQRELKYAKMYANMLNET